MLDALFLDMRAAVRSCRAAPQLTLLITGTIAVAVGMTVATFSVLYAVRFKPLPFLDPHQLVEVTVATPDNGSAFGLFPPTASALFEQSKVFTSLTWFVATRVQVVDGIEPQEVIGAAVSASFFPTFGVKPALGRTFLTGDDEPGAPSIVILSDGLWRRLFGRDPEIVGRTVRVNGELLIVVGVMPASFHMPSDAQVWTPRILTSEDRQHVGPGPYDVVARLRPEIRLRVAADRATAILSRLPVAVNTDPLHVELVPLNDVETSQFAQPLWILFSSVVAVLAIACINVGSLLLARSIERRHDYAVRISLGARPARLVQQVLLESIVLSVAGGISGVLLARALLPVLIALGTERVPRIAEASLNWSVLLFAILNTACCVVVTSVAPAVAASHAGIGDVLARSSGVATPAPHRGSVWILTGEIALTVTLLIAAGVLVRSLLNIQEIDTGIHGGEALFAEVRPMGSSYDAPSQRAQFFDQVLTELRNAVGPATPVATASMLPTSFMNVGLWSSSGALVASIRQTAVSDHYFEALGIPLIAGRDFTPADDEDAPTVAIVDQALATVLGSSVPLGRFIVVKPSREPRTVQVIGVVGNVREQRVVNARPHVYLALKQHPPTTLGVILTTSHPLAARAIVRHAVAAVDPNIPLASISSLSEGDQAQTSWLRFQMTVLTAFAVVALWLTIIGIVGAIAYDARRRTREIGIRRALGASAESIVLLMMRRTVAPLLAGLVAGGVAAINVTQLLRWSLFHVGSAEPAVYVTVAVIIIAAGSIASYVPARRAATIDPSVTLRA
jgi:putative ABC transport system permease protein